MHTQPNQYGEQTQNSDPFSIKNGPLVYEKRHLVHIFISDKPGHIQKLPSQQQLLVKIAIQGNSQNLRLVSIELTSDSELEFNFQFRCNDMDFRRIKEIQKFYIQFRQYPQAIIKNFQKLLTKSTTHNFQAHFTIFSETQGKLELIRKSEFKDDQIMQFSFSRSPQEHIQASVQHRYDMMRREFSARVKRYEEYREIIKAKNPSLMMQIDKTFKSKK